MRRRPPRSTLSSSSAASDVYKRQGIARTFFPRQSHGSLILRGGRPVGSELICQPFTDRKYFWSRPSATTPFPYNAESSSGSNLGPTNSDLAKAVGERIAAL